MDLARKGDPPTLLLMLIGGIPVLLIAAELLAVLLSTWPGVLEGLLLGALSFAALTACVWLPLALIAGVCVVVVVIRSGHGSTVFTYLWRWAAVLALATVVCATLVVLRVPTRVVLIFARPRLEALAPAMSTRRTEPVGWVGAFYFRSSAADSRGGVYFCTTETPDGIGPDALSHGLAYRPNRTGSPYGQKDYTLRHLLGDWYEFEASDDW